MSPGFTLCPIVVSVDGHNLTMIASDGAPFKPLQVQSFIVHPGERSVYAITVMQLVSIRYLCLGCRYDFILTADQSPSTYLLRAAGLFDCSPTKAHTVARIHYRKVYSRYFQFNIISNAEIVFNDIKKKS